MAPGRGRQRGRPPAAGPPSVWPNGCSFPPPASAELAIVVTEPPPTWTSTPSRGRCCCASTGTARSAGVELVAIDPGPGMAGRERGPRDGHSTAGTLGIGLGAIQRQADFADLYSRPGRGTVPGRPVLAPAVSRPPPQPALGGGLIRPITGETVCGDAYGAVQADGAVTAVLCDGLGHGPLAAAAAAAGVAAVPGRPGGRAGRAAGAPAPADERHPRRSGRRRADRRAAGPVRRPGQRRRVDRVRTASARA